VELERRNAHRIRLVSVDHRRLPAVMYAAGAARHLWGAPSIDRSAARTVVADIANGNTFNITRSQLLMAAGAVSYALPTNRYAFRVVANTGISSTRSARPPHPALVLPLSDRSVKRVTAHARAA
jgi:hypothetical protein